MKVGLAYILEKTRYFALLSCKWQYFILKRQETGTEHVAIATLKCVIIIIINNKLKFIPRSFYKNIQLRLTISIKLKIK